VTLYIGIDLGKHLAATVVDENLRCVWTHYRKRPKDGCHYLAIDLMLADLTEASDGHPDTPMGPLDIAHDVIVCAERTWLNAGRGKIDPRDLFPLAEQLGYLHAWASESARYSIYIIDDSAALARETGIHKDRREEVMPTLISGLDWTPYLGPRGGREAIEHLSDSAYLAYVCHRQATWAEKMRGATR
jgi:hypothetical protein